MGRPVGSVTPLLQASCRACLRIAAASACLAAVSSTLGVAAEEVDPARTELTISKAEYDALTEIPILSPVPLTGGWVGGHTMKVAAELAMDIINSQQKILPGYRLNTSWFDDTCNPDYGVQVMLEKWNERGYAALGANGCSAVCRATALLTPKIRIPHISYGCAAGFLQDNVTFPDFGRLMGDESSMADVFKTLGENYGWERMVIVTGSAARFDGPAQALMDYFKDEPLKVDWLTPRNPPWNELLELMKGIKRDFQRVVVVLGYEPFYRRVVCASIIVGLPKGMVWLSVGWHKAGWWTEEDEDLLELAPECTVEAITAQYNGGIGAAGLGAPLPEDMTKPLECLEGYSSQTFRDKLYEHIVSGYPVGQNIVPGEAYHGIAGNGADGMCIWAYLFRHMIFDKGYDLQDLIRPSADVYQEMRDYLKKDLNFFGVIGQVFFDRSNVPGILAVYQVQSGTREMVSTINLEGVMGAVEGVELVWGDGETAPPSSFAPCDPGSIRDAQGECQLCGTGKYFWALMNDCIPCDRGEYNDKEGQIDEISCKPCENGKYADAIGSSTCTDCPAGNFSNTQEGQGAKCEPCPEGEYSSTAGSSECTRCQTGEFQSEIGATGCSPCPGGRTTAFLAAVVPEDCICSEGSYEPYPVQDQNKFLCLPCPEGMTCAEGSRLTSWFDLISGRVGNSSQSLEYPKLEEKYYSTEDKPVYVYQCLNKEDCPGGRPGTCAEKRTGFACGRCEKQYYSFGGQCNKCNAIEMTTLLFPILPLIAGPVITVFLYTRLLEPTHIRNMDSPKNRGLTLFFFFLIHFQTLGIIRQFNLFVPTLVAVSWEGMGMVNSGVQFLRPECAGGGELSDFSVQFMLRTALPLIIGLYFLVCYLVFNYVIVRFTRRWNMGPVSIFTIGMRRDSTINAFGTLMYTFSISILAIAFDLFKCFPHPNGQSSLRVSPDVLCGSDDWNAMLAIGILAILLYFVCSVSLFTYIIYIAPSRFHDPSFRRQWKFLFTRWRSNQWWFGQIFLLKGLFMNLTLVMFTAGALQVLWMGLTLIIYVTSVILLRPWRHTLANAMDGLVSLALLSVTLVSVYFAPRSDDADSSLDKILIVFTFLPIAVVSACVARCFYLWFSQPNVELKQALVTALDAEQMLVAIVGSGTVALLHGMMHTTGTDRQNVLEALKLLLAETSCKQIRGQSRLLQRETAFDLPGRGQSSSSVDCVADNAPVEDPAVLHMQLREWCRAHVEQLEAQTKRIFQDKDEVDRAHFEGAFGGNDRPQLGRYAAVLLDTYENGWVSRVIFESFVRKFATMEGNGKGLANLQAQGEQKPKGRVKQTVVV